MRSASAGTCFAASTNVCGAVSPRSDGVSSKSPVMECLAYIWADLSCRRRSRCSDRWCE